MENDRITCIKFEDHVEVAVKGDHQTVGVMLTIIMKDIIDNQKGGIVTVLAALDTAVNMARKERDNAES